MFAYVDPEIYKLLVEQHKVTLIGEDGKSAHDQGRPGTEQLHLLGPIPIPRRVAGEVHMFRWYPFVRRTQHDQVLKVARGLTDREDMHDLHLLLAAQMTVNSLLLYGDFEAQDTPLVRVHSCCITGETFGSMRCECGPQLDAAFERIVQEGAGGLVYMSSHEGRGIGLWAKGITYILQDMGRDTYDANLDLGLPTDSRDFRDGAFVLLHFLKSPARVRLLSNNPLKRSDLQEHGVEVVSQEALVVGVNPYNQRYMRSKREHGHLIGWLPGEKNKEEEG